MVSKAFALTLVGLCLFGGAVATCDDRQTPGIICETCDGLAVCMNIAGTWTAVEVDKCEAGTFCDSKTGTCTAEPSACNIVGYENGLPECTSAGIFPNPYDCQSYFECKLDNGDLKAEKKSCTGNTAFNAAADSCTLTTSDASCTALQFKCEAPGDAKAWPSNAEIFYVCRRSDTLPLHPHLFRCPAEETFNRNSFSCEAGTAPAPNPGDPGDPTNPSTPGEPEVNPAEHVCVGKEYLLDSKDCTGYYRCPRPGARPLHYNCPSGNYFIDDSTGPCKAGTCTNTPNPNPSNPTNPAPVNPSTPVEPAANPAEHICVGKEYLRDSEDCTGYYRCTRTGARPVHYNCPSGNYFIDDNTGPCKAGTCTNTA